MITRYAVKNDDGDLLTTDGLIYMDQDDALILITASEKHSKSVLFNTVQEANRAAEYWYAKGGIGCHVEELELPDNIWEGKNE